MVATVMSFPREKKPRRESALQPGAAGKSEKKTAGVFYKNAKEEKYS